MNYTYAQLKQMQEDASRRVMEMRQRADSAVGKLDDDLTLGAPETAGPARERGRAARLLQVRGRTG